MLKEIAKKIGQTQDSSKDKDPKQLRRDEMQKHLQRMQHIKNIQISADVKEKAQKAEKAQNSIQRLRGVAKKGTASKEQIEQLHELSKSEFGNEELRIEVETLMADQYRKYFF